MPDCARSVCVCVNPHPSASGWMEGESAHGLHAKEEMVHGAHVHGLDMYVLHARPPGEVCEREVWVLLASTCVLSCARVLCVAIVGTMSLLPIGSSRRSRSSRRAAEDALADGSRPSRHATEDMLADHDEDIYSGRAGTHARMTIYEAILRISPPVSSSHTHAHCSSHPPSAMLSMMLSRSSLVRNALMRRVLSTTNAG